MYGSDTAGRLESRYWVRTAAGVTNRVGTTDAYDAAGDLATVAYSNDPSSTLGIKNIRDRLGRIQNAERHSYGVTGPNMTDANRVNYATRTHNDAGEPLTEAYSGGALAGLSMSRTQYSQRTKAPYGDVVSLANALAGLTVNGNTASRKGEYFSYALNVPNSSAAQYPTVTRVSLYGGGQTETSKAFVPSATENYTHDPDGNLLTDGRWAYTWDAEDRLTQMVRDTDTPSGARQKLVFEYDWQGRPIRKTFYAWVSSAWSGQSDVAFLYDGWHLVTKLHESKGRQRRRSLQHLVARQAGRAVEAHDAREGLRQPLTGGGGHDPRPRGGTSAAIRRHGNRRHDHARRHRRGE